MTAGELAAAMVLTAYGAHALGLAVGYVACCVGTPAPGWERRFRWLSWAWPAAPVVWVAIVVCPGALLRLIDRGADDRP